MGLKRTEEFCQDAVRIALTSGLTRKQVAADLGIGMSTLNKWITAHRDTDVVSKEDWSSPGLVDGYGLPGLVDGYGLRDSSPSAAVLS